jgi:hypothetical protein
VIANSHDHTVDVTVKTVESARAVAALVTIPLRKTQRGGQVADCRCMHRRRRACERLRTASGFGCLQALSDLGQLDCSYPGERRARREVFRSAGQIQLSQPAPRRRCCSSNVGSQRDVGARCRTRHLMPRQSAPNGRPELIGTGVNTQLRQAITLR